MQREYVLFRYVISGAAAAGLHFLVLIGLVEVFGINPTFSSAVGFCSAIIVNYSLQYHWTFSSTTTHFKAFSRYLFVTLAMLGVNTLIFWSSITVLRMHYLVAQALAISVVFFLNFRINRRYTFS